jgi:hypothetical protein
MRLFIETVNSIGAVVFAITAGITVGVMALSLFFRGLDGLFAKPKAEMITFEDVLKRGTLATVHMAGDKMFERVRFVGVPNAETTRSYLPYELNGMVIFDDEKGRRLLVRAENVQLIEIAPDADSV